MNAINRVLSDENMIMFAPEYYYDEYEYLYVTCGLANERIYVQKKWGNFQENWYKKGNNHFSCYKRQMNGEWKLFQENVIDTSDFEDVMKLSVVNTGVGKLMWFSGLKDNHWNIYIAKNAYNIEKIVLPNASGMEIHQYLPCVLYDGTYRMWYVSRNMEHRRIFYAKSQDGINWTDNILVLDIGEEFSGDNYAADCPNVVRSWDGYIMFYGGGSSRGIHLAESKDGITWNKRGLIIPRGSETEDSYNYSFYPALAVKSKCLKYCKKLTLYYAGEDIDNNWRILSMTDDFLENIYEPQIVSLEDVRYIIKCLKQVPTEFFMRQEDCNCKNYYYEDEKIVQLRPSTVPVFLFKNEALVVKVMTDRVKAENEYKARLFLKNELDVVDVSIFYMGNVILLIMPYINDACPCNEMFLRDTNRFKSLYIQMLLKCADVIRNNFSTSHVQKIQYTGQTLELLSKWCDEIEVKYKDVELISGVSGEHYNIGEKMREAKALINGKPTCCALFSGDISLHNVLCRGNDIKWIDFEYWGYYDVDYIVAKIVGSLYKHCDCLRVTDFRKEANKIIVKYSCDDNLKQLFCVQLYIQCFKETGISIERIKAYILIKMYFRLMTAYDYMNEYDVNYDMDGETCSEKLKYAIFELVRIAGVLDFR